MRVRIIHDPVWNRYRIEYKEKWYKLWQSGTKYIYVETKHQGGEYTQEEAYFRIKEEYSRLLSEEVVLDSKYTSKSFILRLLKGT